MEPVLAWHATETACFVAKFSTEIGDSRPLLFIEVVDAENFAVFRDANNQQPSLMIGVGECGDRLDDLFDKSIQFRVLDLPLLKGRNLFPIERLAFNFNVFCGGQKIPEGVRGCRKFLWDLGMRGRG